MQALCADRKFYELSIYDIRIPGATERVHRKRAVWQEQSDIEDIDNDRFVLIVYAGGARRWAP